MKIARTGNRIRLTPEWEEDTDVIKNTLIGARLQKSGDYTVGGSLANELLLFNKAPDSLFTTNTFNLQEGHPGLKSYQVFDVARMLNLKGCLNANPMGYGKTVETIEYIKQSKVEKVLIIAPKSVLEQWASEIEKWWPNCPLGVYVNPSKIHFAVDICIVNYEKLERMNLESTLWDLIVCDEAHRIKNPKSKRSVKLKQIPTMYKLALTGTPITNKPNDLFNILHWLNPTYVGESYWDFVNAFCEVEDSFFGNKIIGLTKDEDKQKLLKRILEVASVRNPDLHLTKGKQIIDVTIKMTTEQGQLYKDVKNLVFSKLPENMTIANGLSKLIRLQQVTSNTALYDINKNPKFEWIADLLEDNPDEKIVVFSKFSSTLASLNKFLKDRGYQVATIVGSLEDRMSEKIKFTTPEYRIITGTIGALGTGVDGLQHESSTVVFIDRDWSPAINEQAEDRVNRLGQTKRVNVYNLMCKGSIDYYVGKLLIKKADDIRELLLKK